MYLLNKPSTILTERSLDVSSLRQRTIANNIANNDTPNFKRSEVQFEQLLQKELKSTLSFEAHRTDRRHYQFGTQLEIAPLVKVDRQTAMNNNLNNVDIDAEMALQAKNSLHYNTLVDLMSYDLKHAKTALDRR